MSFDLNELGGDSKSWSPAEIGDKIKGTLLSINRVQQTDFQTNEPLTWADGTPRKQTVIELQTDQGDGDDDGVRSVWLKGGKNFEPNQGKGQSGEEALKSAVKETGAKSIDEGATLTVVMSGLAKPTTRGFQPAKLYTMKYEAPKVSADVDDLFD